MALTDSFPGPNGLTDSIEAGKDLAALVRHDSNGTPRAGITYKPTGNLITTRSDMRVNIAPFKAVLVRQGAVRLLANDAADPSPDFTVPAANSRIDVLYVKVGEIALGDAQDGPFFGIVEGEPAPIPTKPVLSVEGALELATVQIPSTATGTNSSGVVISQTAPTTGAPEASWVNLGYISNTQSPGFGNQPSYLLGAGTILLAGATQKISTAWRNGDILFTLPAEARPTLAAYFVAGGSGNSSAVLQVLPTGAVSVKDIVSGNCAWLSVDGWNIRR